jgi:hypothetical protein
MPFPQEDDTGCRDFWMSAAPPATTTSIDFGRGLTVKYNSISICFNGYEAIENGAAPPAYVERKDHASHTIDPGEHRRNHQPIFEAASERHPEATFAACNTEEQSELAAMFQIRSIPTLVVFRDGIGVFSQPGMLPAEALDELMGKVRGLDMEEVRTEIQKQQGAAATA